MPLLQPGSRSPKVQARLARELAGGAAEQADIATEAALIATDGANVAVTAAETAETNSTEALAQSSTVYTFQQVRDSSSPIGVVTAIDAGDGTATINIAAHDRSYLDGTATIALDAGALTGKAHETEYHISYLDPTFAGGAVVFEASTNIEDAITSLEEPARHFVQTVTTPAAGGAETTSEGGSGIPWWKTSDSPGV